MFLDPIFLTRFQTRNRGPKTAFPDPYFLDPFSDPEIGVRKQRFRTPFSDPEIRVPKRAPAGPGRPGPARPALTRGSFPALGPGRTLQKKGSDHWKVQWVGPIGEKKVKKMQKTRFFIVFLTFSKNHCTFQWSDPRFWGCVQAKGKKQAWKRPPEARLREIPIETGVRPGPFWPVSGTGFRDPIPGPGNHGSGLLISDPVFGPRFDPVFGPEIRVKKTRFFDPVFGPDFDPVFDLDFDPFF